MVPMPPVVVKTSGEKELQFLSLVGHRHASFPAHSSGSIEPVGCSDSLVREG